MLPLRDHEPSERFPAVTIGIIGLNIFAFFIELSQPDLEVFLRQWALVPTTLHWSEPLTLLPFLTSQFLHAGFAHILFNMWYLWIFGDNVEGRIGHFPFALFYLTSGVLAAAAQLLLGGLVSDIPMLGASGAVAGVLGTYLVLYPHHRVDTLVPTFLGFYQRATLPAGLVLLFWFIAQLFNGVAALSPAIAAMGGVAYFAHIGGFAFGWGVGQLLKRNSRTRSTMEM